MTTSPKLLALETSGRLGSVALLDDADVLHVRTLNTAGRRHAQTLLAETVELLKSRETPFADLDGVAVSIGPGSFTGLRVGVVAAKTMAHVLGVPLLAVDTFAGLALRVAREAGDVSTLIVLDDAQRGDLFVQEYEVADGSARPTGPLVVEPADEWITGRSEEQVLTGPGCERFGDQLRERCRLVDSSLWNPSAETVAVLGREKLLALETADPVSLEPAYRRRSSAEVKWEERRRTAPGE